MSEVQQDESNNNPINDEILQELEKISNLEKKQKTLFMKNAVIKNEVASIKKVLDENNLEENDEDNVLEEKKISPNLTPVEKKRYKLIGEEFMKGAGVVFNEIKKQQQLKEKMSTQTKEAKQLKKIEDETKKDEKKKKKGNKFLVIGLAIAAVAGVLYVFREKLANVFKGSDGLEDVISSFTDGLGNFGNGVIGQIIDSISNTIGGFFSGQNNELYKMIDTFFTQTLPKSIKYAGIHVISLFSESASKSLADEASSASSRSTQEIQNAANRNPHYDATRAARQSANVSGIAGAGTEAEQQAALRNLGVTSLDERLKTVLLPLFNQQLFHGAQSESERLAIAFQENTYGIRAFMQEFAMSTDERVVQMRERMESGQSTEEDKKQFAEMMGAHFGREVDAEFQNQINSTFFNNPSNAAALLQSARTFQQHTEMLEAGIASNQATIKARGERIQRREAQITERDGTQTVDVTATTAALTGPPFVTETQKFFETFKSMVSGNIQIGEEIVKSTSTFLNNFVKSSFDKAISIFSNIFNGLLLGGGSLLMSRGQNSRFNPNLSGGGRTQGQLAEQSTEYRNAQSTPINVLDIRNSQRPLVLVSLSLDGEPLAKFSTINAQQTQILNTIKESNIKLQSIINSVDDGIEKANDADAEQRIGIFRRIFDVIAACDNNDKRITHIEAYLESQDNDGNDDSDVKDFALQAQS